MDPITQGALGAAFPVSLARRERVRAAAMLGALSGMAPDLDVLIRSSVDPLLFLEYHRHFTHSLAFIPIGAALCALALHGFVRRRMRPGETYLWCLAGYATHALLDACTPYGTMLLWPFSDARIAWNNVSVIDPIATLPLLAGVLLAFRLRSARIGRLAFGWLVGYLLLGVVQHQRALDAVRDLAAERGLDVRRIEAFPQYASLLLWRVVTETDDAYHVDAIRTGTQIRSWPGPTSERLVPARDLAWLDPDSQQARDLGRFAWFANGWLAADPADPLRILDMRYSILPNGNQSIFAIGLDPTALANAHVAWDARRREAETETFVAIWAMQRGIDPVSAVCGDMPTSEPC